MWNEGLEYVSDGLARYLSWEGSLQLVGRASLGLEAVLRSRRSTEPVRVALSPIVCQDVVSAVLESGCVPHFVDVHPESGDVSPASWQSARSAGCTVAIVVHLYGRLADVAAARAAFPSDECLVIDDGAQAFGSSGPDGLAGTLGDVGLVSFGATKQINSGGAAVLFRSDDLLKKAQFELKMLNLVSPSRAHEVELSFRARYDTAREALAASGTPDLFAGLLEGYGDAIRLHVDPRVVDALPPELNDFSRRIADRVQKARLWEAGLMGSRLVGLPIREGDVPWRYACRLPGASWAEQRSVAQAIRAVGISTSNWYVPANWFIANHPALPGAETFAREVFQFWVDPSMTADEVSEAADRVRVLVGA